jgi:nicotinamidase/pyrazinamidase
MPDYDPKTALVVVDVQNDFVAPRGSLYVKGGEAVIEVINSEIEKATRSRALVVYSQDWHPETTPHFQNEGGVWPVHCVADSWGAKFHSGLKVMADAPLVRKGTAGEDGYSVFSVRDPRTGASYPTQLEGILRALGIRRIVLAGLATDYCVKETALDGRRLGFEVEVLRDGVRAVDLQPGDGQRALEVMEAAGSRIS